MDLSYFDEPITAAPSEIRIGYAAITWGGTDRDATDDIADLGYTGIQLRSTIVPEWCDKPRALADELAKRKLTFVALSSGGADIQNDRAAEIAAHVKNARFVHDCGGLYLQCTDSRPKRTLTSADYRALGALLTEIGKRTADLGVALGYHPHMGAVGERPEEVERVLGAADPRYVKLELDVAHYQQGGGDPVRAIHRHAERLLFLHIKDVAPWSGPAGYRFVELGQGQVNLNGVFAALRAINFRGWAVVELDEVPDKTRSPKDYAAVNKNYLISDCGLGASDFHPQSTGDNPK